jgi:hypothetical protein
VKHVSDVDSAYQPGVATDVSSSMDGSVTSYRGIQESGNATSVSTIPGGVGESGTATGEPVTNVVADIPLAHVPIVSLDNIARVTMPPPVADTTGAFIDVSVVTADKIASIAMSKAAAVTATVTTGSVVGTDNITGVIELTAAASADPSVRLAATSVAVQPIVRVAVFTTATTATSTLTEVSNVSPNNIASVTVSAAARQPSPLSVQLLRGGISKPLGTIALRQRSQR